MITEKELKETPHLALVAIQDETVSLRDIAEGLRCKANSFYGTGNDKIGDWLNRVATSIESRAERIESFVSDELKTLVKNS